MWDLVWVCVPPVPLTLQPVQLVGVDQDVQFDAKSNRIKDGYDKFDFNEHPAIIIKID